MKTALAMQEEQTESTIDEVVQRGLELCLLGQRPIEAARSVSLEGLNGDELYSLAVVGMARLINHALERYNNECAGPPVMSEGPKATRKKEGGVVGRVTQAERREVLYRRVSDALDARHAGCDGVMKSLSDFTVEDHRFRLNHCTAVGRGWKNSARFHQESLAALKACEVQTIAALPEDERARLRDRLR